MRRLLVAFVLVASPVLAQQSAQSIAGEHAARIGWALKNCGGGKISATTHSNLELVRRTNPSEFGEGVAEGVAEVTAMAKEVGIESVCERLVEMYGPRGNAVPGAWLPPQQRVTTDRERQKKYSDWQPFAIGKIAGTLAWMQGKCDGRADDLAPVVFNEAKRRGATEYERGYQEGISVYDGYVAMAGGGPKARKSICALILNAPAYRDLWRQKP